MVHSRLVDPVVAATDLAVTPAIDRPQQSIVNTAQFLALLDLASTVREQLERKARRTKGNRLARFEAKLLAMAIKAERA